MNNEAILKNLVELVKDVYGEGYIGGITDNYQYDAYARAIMRIFDGEAFSEDMVVEEYKRVIRGEIGCD